MGKVSTIFDRAAALLPTITGWLWPIGPLAVIYQYRADLGGGSFLFEPWYSSLEPEIPRIFLVLFCTSLVVLSLLSRRAEARGWYGRAWVSLGAWLSLLVAANLIVLWMDLPWAGVTPLLGSDISHGTVIERIAFVGTSTIGLVANWRVLLLVLAFAAVLEVHARKNSPHSSPESHDVGRRVASWKAVLLATLVGVLIETFPPFLTVVSSAVGWSTTIFDAIYEFVLLTLGSYFDALLILFTAMAFYAWKTSAHVEVDDRGVRLYVARGAVCVFSVRWRHVLSVRMIDVGGSPLGIRLTIGRLPWFRAWMTLGTTRDGVGLENLIRSNAKAHGVLIQAVSVRPIARRVGIVSLGLCTVLVLAFSLAMYRELQSLTELMPDRPQVFGERDLLSKFGILSGLGAALLGVGLGALLVRRDASIRLIPMVGVAIAASMLPDPFNYWLVTIAIYAILMARLGPIEPQPWIAFPDLESVELGMWFSAYKSCFAVAGYILAVLALTRPWTASLPTWPYRFHSRSIHSEHAEDENRALAST